jgi:hypothetical protein
VGEPENPFETIESAHQYMRLLSEVLEDSQQEIRDEVALARSDGAERRLQALNLVDYHLKRLKLHVDASRRTLNDLRTLRRLLLGEREESRDAAPSQIAGVPDARA